MPPAPAQAGKRHKLSAWCDPPFASYPRRELPRPPLNYFTCHRLFAFVGKLAGERLEQIGARDDALEAALLVDHHSELGGGPLEPVERREHRRLRRYRARGAQDALEVDRLAVHAELEHVLLAHDPDHLFG